MKRRQLFASNELTFIERNRSKNPTHHYTTKRDDMTIKIECHGESHVGRHRSDNEDQFLIADLNKSMKIHQTSLGLNHQTRLMGESQGKLLLVADGLGGHASGERASSLAVDGVANYILNAMDWFLRLNEDNEPELIEELKKAIFHSQNVLGEEAAEVPQRRGMATTLTMAYIIWPSMYVVHVGDTRCYAARCDKIEQLTTDHNIANLVKEAEAQSSTSRDTSDDTKPHNPMGHALWNVVGGSDKTLEPQVEKYQLAPGDRLLLCSDGLTSYIEEDELHKALMSDRTTKETCEYFIERANALGGKDNITVIVAAIEQVESVDEQGDCQTDELEGDFVLKDLD